MSPPNAERPGPHTPVADTSPRQKVDPPKVPHHPLDEKDAQDDGGHQAVCELLRAQLGGDFIDFDDSTRTVLVHARKPEQRTPERPPIIAVLPVAPRDVFVADRTWYGHADAHRDPLELVGVAVAADGRVWQVILDDGVPQVLSADNELAYEHVPERYDNRSRKTA